MWKYEGFLPGDASDRRWESYFPSETNQLWHCWSSLQCNAILMLHRVSKRLHRSLMHSHRLPFTVYRRRRPMMSVFSEPLILFHVCHVRSEGCVKWQGLWGTNIPVIHLSLQLERRNKPGDISHPWVTFSLEFSASTWVPSPSPNYPLGKLADGNVLYISREGRRVR